MRSPRHLMRPTLKLLLGAFAAALILIIAGPWSSTAQDRPVSKPPSNTRLFAKGPIELIDSARKLFVIKTRAGSQQFELSPDIRVFRGRGKERVKITVDQLRPGEIIALSYFTDERGQPLLIRIKAATLVEPAGPEAAANAPST